MKNQTLLSKTLVSSYPEVISGFFVVVNGLVQVCDVTLVYLSNGLMVFGGYGEPSHISVNINALRQAANRLCKTNTNKFISPGGQQRSLVISLPRRLFRCYQ